MISGRAAAGGSSASASLPGLGAGLLHCLLPVLCSCALHASLPFRRSSSPPIERLLGRLLDGPAPHFGVLQGSGPAQRRQRSTLAPALQSGRASKRRHAAFGALHDIESQSRVYYVVLHQPKSRRTPYKVCDYNIPICAATTPGSLAVEMGVVRGSGKAIWQYN